MKRQKRNVPNKKKRELETKKKNMIRKRPQIK